VHLLGFIIRNILNNYNSYTYIYITFTYKRSNKLLKIPNIDASVVPDVGVPQNNMYGARVPTPEVHHEST
jgi:hypothetical protein